jgi:ribosomal protein S18 acetylase RimI-like enzyme
MHTPAGRVALRDVRSSDAPAVHALLLDILQEGRGFVALPDEVGLDPAPSVRAIGAVEAGDGVGVVATLNDGLVGYCIARPSGPHRLRHDVHLELVVAASARGMGIGGALLDALIDRVRGAKRFVRLSLSVFADNGPAIGLYRARGFVEEGRRIGAVLDRDGTLRDDVLMVMRVDEA